MIPSNEPARDPLAPVDGMALSGYVEVCRALVRTAGDSTRRIEEVLAAHDLTPDRWERIREGWSERIRRHPRIRTEFSRLYAAPSGEPAVGNE